MADLEFEIRTKNVEEIYPKDLDPRSVPEFLAELKAEALKADLSKDEVLLTADTIVLKDGEIFEKPEDETHAIQMIGEMVNSWHDVITGVCILYGDTKVTFSDTTEVKFRDLSKEQIEYYVKKYKPFDKAGSYAIQEWIGVVAVKKIKGDIYNVIGLPVGRVVATLSELPFEIQGLVR